MPTKTKPTVRPTPAGAVSPSPSDPALSIQPDFVPSLLTGWIGVIGFILGVVCLNKYETVGQELWHRAIGIPRYWEGLAMMAFTSVPMLVCDWMLLRRRNNPSGSLGVAPPPRYSVGRTLTKLVGLIGSVALLAVLYWIFPEYFPSLQPDSGFYSNFFSLCRAIAPWAVIACAAYFYLIDGRMAEPHDGYWYFGRILLLNFRDIDWAKVRNHLRTWAVKGFFMPLMFTYLCDNLPGLHYHGWPDFLTGFHYLHNFLFTIDLAFVSCGYVLTLRWVQSHVRSAEPTALGWTAALMCYMPFWKTIGDLYLGYWGDNAWDRWLTPEHTLFYVWGAAILFFETIFVWATISFGLRFSNLTHRGIVRKGPYYFTKHPAYISKICAFLLIAVPWLDSRGLEQSVRNCLMLGGLAFVYWIRAKTEERHLSGVDATYALYAEEIRERHRRWFGPFAGFSRKGS